MNDNAYTDEERTIIEYQKLKQEGKPLGKFMRQNYYTLKKVLPGIKGGAEDLKLLNLIGPEEEYVEAETNKEKRAELNKRINDVSDKDIKKVKPLKKDIQSVKERERASSIMNIPDAELNEKNLKLNEKDVQEAFAASGRPYKKAVIDDVEVGYIPKDVRPAYEKFKKQYAEDALREYNARQFEKNYGNIAPAALSFVFPRIVDKYQAGYKPDLTDAGLDMAELLAGGAIGKGVKAAKSLPKLERVFSGAQKAKDAVSGSVKKATKKMPAVGSAIGHVADASVVPTAANVGFQAIDDYVYDDSGLSRGQATLNDYLKNAGMSMGFASLPEFGLSAMQQKRKDAYEKALEKTGMYKNYDFSDLEKNASSKYVVTGKDGKQKVVQVEDVFKAPSMTTKGDEAVDIYSGYRAADDISGMGDVLTSNKVNKVDPNKLTFEQKKEIVSKSGITGIPDEDVETLFNSLTKKNLDENGMLNVKEYDVSNPNKHMGNKFDEQKGEHKTDAFKFEQTGKLSNKTIKDFAKKNNMSFDDAYQYLMEHRDLVENALNQENVKEMNKLYNRILEAAKKNKRKTEVENFGKNYIPAYYTTLMGRRSFGGQNTGNEDD